MKQKHTRSSNPIMGKSSKKSKKNHWKQKASAIQQSFNFLIT